MNREDVFSLIVILQRARRDCSVYEALSVLRESVISGGRQPDFMYDVLAFLEEAEGADYSLMKDLISAAIARLNKALSNS
jgi:hypothetical protein